MPKKARPVTTGDLYRLRQLADCQLTPDGKSLITAMDSINKEENKKVMHLYLQPTRGGALRQFTRGEHVDHHPRVSPDGKLIAFISNRSEKSQVHLIRSDGGESWQLSKMEGNISGFAWAPDSKRLAVVFSPQDEEAKEREKLRKQGKKGKDAPKVRRITRFLYRMDGAGFFPEGKSELHIVNAGTGKAPLLVKDGKDNDQPAFTPDGRSVVFVSNKSKDPELDFLRYDLWLVAASGKGKVQKIATFDGPSYSPAVSPDGKLVAFRGWPDPHMMWNERNARLYAAPLSGGKPVELGSGLDRPVENLSINDTWGLPSTAPPLWSPDGTSIYSVVTTDGNTEAYRFEVEGGACAPVFSEPGVVLDFAIDFDAGKLYVSHSSTGIPGDLYSCRMGGAGLKRLSRVNESWLGRRDLGQVREVWVKGDGGHKIHGWIMTPPGFSPKRKYPAILYIHGGPSVAYARAIIHEFNYLAGKGYVVFFCNPRGSHGYGVKHLSAISRKWGDNDYKDVMKFTDYVLRSCPFVDRGRLGVTGGSYGGYMTNWIIGHGNRFKAAVTQRSVSNFLSFYGSSDVGFHFHKGFGWNSKSPWEDKKRFLDMSPMTYLPNAKTPTLVIHSEGDLRCPIEQGEQVYVQLKLQGVDTEFVRFPEESHGLSRGGRTDRRIERLERISGWFDKYLK
ncbi:S9 family peptidase [bacterium]|nr:S9 family peptidase [bacterium]